MEKILVKVFKVRWIIMQVLTYLSIKLDYDFDKLILMNKLKTDYPCILKLWLIFFTYFFLMQNNKKLYVIFNNYSFFFVELRQSIFQRESMSLSEYHINRAANLWSWASKWGFFQLKMRILIPKWGISIKSVIIV